MARARKWMQAVTVVVTALTFAGLISIFILGAEWRGPDCKTVRQLTEYTRGTTTNLNNRYWTDNPPTAKDFQDWADTIHKYQQQLTDPRYRQFGQFLVDASQEIANLASAPTDPLPVGGDFRTWVRKYNSLRAGFDYNLDNLNYYACQRK
jgi:hypothetical protein